MRGAQYGDTLLFYIYVLLRNFGILATFIVGSVDYLIVRYDIVAYGGLRADSERQRQRLT